MMTMTMILHRSLFIFLTIVMLQSNFCCAGSCTSLERDALLDFVRHAVDEDPAGYWFSSWLHPSTSTNTSADNDCCSWNGVTCDEEGMVTEISIHNCDNDTTAPYKVRAQMTPEALGPLSAIERLSSLDFGCQNFYGSIAAEIGNLTSLTYIDLNRNNLSGLLPPSMQNLKSLAALDLSYNRFSPQDIPSLLTHLPLLIYLDLSHNSFTGDISDSFTNVTQLQLISLANNRLDGLLPASIQNMAYLQYLDLAYNNFRGAIPDMFANLTQMAKLYLSHNQFDGVIPPSLQQLKSIRLLNLSYNHFSPQQIPSTFFTLPFLTILDLSFNNFTGIDSLNPSNSNYSLADAPPKTQLQYLNLASNKLTDGIFSEMSSFRYLKNLSVLDLRDNSLQGSFDDVFSDDVFPELWILDMNNNRLQGSIPKFISFLRKLQVLDLGWNELSGSIPEWIGTSLSAELRVLVLTGNHFTGSIPANLGGLSAMQNYSQNASSGLFDSREGNVILSFNIALNIPIGMKGLMLTFKNVPSLSALDLSQNQLSGPIPADLGKLKGLVSLNLSGNHLEGEIPSALGNLTNLESLDLSRNKLQGHIPGSLGDLDRLAYVNLSSNGLSGSIPSSPHWLDTLGESCFRDNDGLCISSKSLSGLPPCHSMGTSSTGRPSADVATTSTRRLEWAAFGVGYPVGLTLGVLFFFKFIVHVKTDLYF